MARPSLLALVAVVLAAVLPVATGEEPYKRMLDDTLVFTGTETLPSETGAAGEMVIGLFAPDDDEHPVGRAITRGAMLAVDQANASEGIAGRPIRLIRRWADDPWGAGANEVVRLVFEDHAWAIIGGPDGASTHIAQQVATRAHIPLIAPVSSDPTLTQTRVPWIFRLPPDDAVQAELLVREGIIPHGLERIGLITATDHDSRTAAAELITALERAGTPPRFHLESASTEFEPYTLASRIATFNPDGLVIRISHTDVRSLLAAIDAAGISVPVFLPWIPGFDFRQFPLPYNGPVVATAPFVRATTCGPDLKLERAFIARHGNRPTPPAAYGYDAAMLVIDKIRTGATGRVDLRRRLAAQGSFAGASGEISWDSGGGNLGKPVLMK